MQHLFSLFEGFKKVAKVARDTIYAYKGAQGFLKATIIIF
jgi:hypothetical protein